MAYPAATLYANAGSAGLHDITAGGNGECKGKYTSCSGSLSSPLDCGAGNTICNAAGGYDGPTGVGTPIGLSAFQPVPGQIEGPAEGEGPPGGSGGGPSGPGGGSGGSGGSGAGGNEGTASPGAGSSTEVSPSPTPSNVSKSKTTAPSRPRILGLSLTLSAVIALNRSHPQLSKIAFGFSLSAPVTVRATLARWARVRGHWRWITLRGTNSIAAHVGVNHAHLRGRGALPPGAIA